MKIGRFFQVAILILLAAGIQPAYSALWQWSRTASSNAGADPSINWAEGQSPSSINDSARAMMARIADYRDDISGLLATAGGPVAFTVTTNQGLNATPNDGQLLSVTMNATNGAASTLAADGGTAFPIQSSPGVAVASATMVSGSPYSMKFSTANSAWMLRGFYASSTSVPLGALVPYTGTTAPNSNFVFAVGQCLSTTTYASYWALLGSPASGTCAGGQFRVLDLMGRIPAGLDTMGGAGPVGRMTSSPLGCGTTFNTVGAVCVNGSESQTLTLAQIPSNIISTNASQAISVTSQDTGIPRNAVAFSGQRTDGAGTGIVGPGGGSVSVIVGSVISTANNSITVTSGNTSGQPHPIVQPTIGVTYLLRVL